MASESESEDEMSYFERQKLPMVVACKSGDADTLRAVLAAGGDPETLDGSGWTPIMQVCQKGDHVEMVSLLLAAGADPNRRIRCGSTGLHFSANMGRVECTALLLSAGASVHAITTPINHSQTPAEDMSDRRCRRILPMLLRAGSPIPRLVYFTEQYPDWTFTLKWLCNGEDPYNAQNYPIMCEYRAKVVAAGSWAAYEKAHRARLTKTLAPKFPQIPAEIVPTIVAFAFHTGWY